MELQPFGPVEQAIQKADAPDLPKPKSIMPFLGGVLVTLAAIAVGWTIFSYIKRKKDNKQKEKNASPRSIN
jgi:hypothetical protein